MRKSKNGTKDLPYKIISTLLIIISVLFIALLSYANLLPAKYLSTIIIILAVFCLINTILLSLPKLKKKIKRIVSAIALIAILLITTGSFYICRTLGVLLNNGDSRYKLEHYSVIVLKTSKYKELSDIKNEDIGYYMNSTGAKEANNYLKKKVIVNLKSYASSDSLINDLLESKIECILLEDSMKNIMNEEIENFSNEIRVLYKFTIKIETTATLKDVDVTEKPFAIYISGIDTYGEISSVSRSDVNMLMVINPRTKQVLLVSIPRDYYVQLHGTTGYRDKLTHAGIYGIDMSIKTIEDLLELEINYYLKVNFTSVIDIVDALGGLDVYSEYTFVSYSGFSFKEGYNSVNGEQALDFARTRKAFSDGDRQRGKNQQALIESIIRKATNKSIVTKYNSLLSAIDGKYQTNMGTKKIMSLIKFQLDKMPSWNITSYSLEGSDSSNYTYTYNQLLYVMEPNEESVNEAIGLIDSVLNNNILNSSYGEMTGNTNKVNRTSLPEYAPPPTNAEDNKKDQTIEYTVTFDSNNSEPVSIQTIASGKKVLKPEDPVYHNSTFVCWSLNGKVFDFDTPITSNITLKAVWNQEESNKDTNSDSTITNNDDNPIDLSDDV